jgi:hypothetical protein
MDGKKLKELLRSETKFAMCGKNARSLSKERDNAAIQINALTTVWQLALNFSAKKFLLTVRLLTELLRRAAEIDPEAASLLSVHPRNVDGAILLVHLRG